ncbi:hypothetical protein [Actibacterium pelagium]|uniref:Glycosyltransferase n=1 Tax=Actibacterium pelagium TaxID=2029103 RepID=A0A917ALK8_9RHOB|nr:hypothetical protein [Actibacterium pelagium]GGE59174.1 hypothetical protein GCM10011517_28630 [Actibacterium pelagium]
METLVAQSAKVEEIRLNIPKSYRRFPDYDGSLPDVPKGIRIVRPEEDWGPATKVLATAFDLRGEDCQIAFCDDDNLYPSHWAQKMLDAKAERPDDAIGFIAEDIAVLTKEPVVPTHFPRAVTARKDLTYRWERLKQQIKARQLRAIRGKPPRIYVSKAGYRDTLYGFGGALVQPDYFDNRSYEIPPVVWAVDDIWLSGCLARQGIGIWAVAGEKIPALSPAHYHDGLAFDEIEGANRKQANLACIRYMQDTYGIWKPAEAQ